jgi:hypothetical protein
MQIEADPEERRRFLDVLSSLCLLLVGHGLAGLVGVSGGGRCGASLTTFPIPSTLSSVSRSVLFELFDNGLRLRGRASIDFPFRIRIAALIMSSREVTATSRILRMYLRMVVSCVSPSIGSRNVWAIFFMQDCIDDPSAGLICRQWTNRMVVGVSQVMEK